MREGSPDHAPICRVDYAREMPQCPVCGHGVPQPERGRPRIYCSLVCKDVARAFNVLDGALSELDVTEKARRLLKAELWALANLLNDRGAFTVLRSAKGPPDSGPS
jgi:hypothetical protein